MKQSLSNVLKTL